MLAHADDDVRQLALHPSNDDDVDMRMALQQIQGRQMARRKLPSWAAIDGIVYPPHLSMEQCSSEATARYKATMMHQLTMCNAPFHPAVNSSSSNSTFLDLTGGFGVDTAFLSDLFGTTVYVERQPELCAIAQSNFATLGKAITTVCGDATDCLHQLQQHVALIFLDPARRDDHGDRTYGIADCTPNVLPLLPELLQKADRLLLKLSPMLDWRKAVADVGLQHVEQVHIVAVHGECKELLLLLSAQGSQAPSIICANDDSREEFALTADDCPTNLINPITPISQINPISQITPITPTNLINPNGHAPLFLYEPNAALMKAGLFAQLALRYGIEALSPNSHLFASSHRVDDFPGRSFLLTDVSTMNKQELRSKVLPLKQANITVRNFPLSVAELRKRLKLREGGSNYVFATTLATGDKVLLVCQRLL